MAKEWTTGSARPDPSSLLHAVVDGRTASSTRLAKVDALTLIAASPIGRRKMRCPDDGLRQAPRVTLATGVVTGDASSDVTGDDIEDDMGEGTRWLTYEDMGIALGITTESAKRLAMRHKWPRRPGNDGRALVAVPEERLEEAAQAGEHDATGDDGDDAAPTGPGSDARALIGYLERRVEELGDELADARDEARTARVETEALRVQAGRVDVLTALVETERNRTAEVRADMAARLDLGRALLEGVQAERDRLLVDRIEQRTSWVDRLFGQRR